jgi:hypothetical protein
LIISFQEGWSTAADLEATFFVVVFFVVVDFLGDDFFVAADLAPLEDLERTGDFLVPAATSGAGEANGDGRGEDIA